MIAMVRQSGRTRLGEAKLESPRVDFDRRLKLKFHGSDTSTDTGLLTYHELDDALRLSELAEDVLLDIRGWTYGAARTSATC